MELLCPTCQKKEEINITNVGTPNTTGEKVNFIIVQCKVCGYSYGTVDTLLRESVSQLNDKIDNLKSK